MNEGCFDSSRFHSRQSTSIALRFGTLENCAARSGDEKWRDYRTMSTRNECSKCCMFE